MDNKPMPILPNNILRSMSKEARAALGKGNQLPEEIAAKQESKSERELQKDMCNLLNQRNLFFIRSRMDRKTTTPRGTPDYLIVFNGGRALAVEAKMPKGKLSAEQVDMHKEYRTKTGRQVIVVRSVEEFKLVLDEISKEPVYPYGEISI